MRNHKIRITKKIVFTIFLAVFLSFSGTHNSVLGQDKTGYAPVNGLEMYYEIHGEGDLSTEALAQAEPHQQRSPDGVIKYHKF